MICADTNRPFSTPASVHHIHAAMYLRVIAYCAALLFCGCDYNPAERLLGAWEGREPDGTRMLMLFERDGQLTVAAGSIKGTGTYLVHPRTVPLHIDLDFQLGDTHITAQSIFVFLSADKLKLAQPTKDRPADFGDKVLLLTRRAP